MRTYKPRICDVCKTEKQKGQRICRTCVANNAERLCKKCDQKYPISEIHFNDELPTFQCEGCYQKSIATKHVVKGMDKLSEDVRRAVIEDYVNNVKLIQISQKYQIEYNLLQSWHKCGKIGDARRPSRLRNNNRRKAEERVAESTILDSDDEDVAPIEE